MPGGHSKAAVDLGVVQGRQHPVDLSALGEGGGALQEHQLRRQGLVLLENIQSMEQGGFRAGGVPRDPLGPSNHLSPMRFGRCCNGVVIGAHHHLSHAGTGPGCGNGAADQGHAAHWFQILSGDSLGASSGRNQRQCSRGCIHR